MSLPSSSRFSFLLWVVLALALVLGVAADLSAATVTDSARHGPVVFAMTAVSRTRVVQVAAVGMALALFIIMRSTKY
jgi:hypothetical protein